MDHLSLLEVLSPCFFVVNFCRVFQSVVLLLIWYVLLWFLHFVLFLIRFGVLLVNQFLLLICLVPGLHLDFPFFILQYFPLLFDFIFMKYVDFFNVFFLFLYPFILFLQIFLSKLVTLNITVDLCYDILFNILDFLDPIQVPFC